MRRLQVGLRNVLGRGAVLATGGSEAEGKVPQCCEGRRYRPVEHVPESDTD